MGMVFRVSAKLVEKYNGTVSFTDKGDIFEVSAMLYGIEVRE